MAERYWVGGTGNWSDDTNHWATSSGGSPGAGNKPTAADNANFDALSNTIAYTCTIDAAAVCLDLVIGNPLAGVITLAGSSTLGISGNLTMATGMTRTYTGTITFNATATGKTITMNSVALAGAVTFNGVGGGWTFQDAVNIGSGTMTLTNGTLDTNGKTVTAQTFNSTNSNTRTLTLGASAVNLTVQWDLTTTTGLTFNANTSTITIANNGTNVFRGGGLTYNNLVFTGGGNPAEITGANTFANFTSTTTGSTTMRMQFSANQTVTGTLTATGAAAGRGRVRLGSDVRGTQRTITSAVVALTNVDFSDIVGAGAASWSGTSIGNASNNSNITFTAAVTRYWVGGTGSWFDTAEWSTSSGGGSGASAPLCHDTAVFDASSFSADGQVVTLDGAFYPTIDFTNIDQNITLAPTSSFIVGSLILKSGMTVTTGAPTMFGLGTTFVDFGGITVDVGNWTINVGTGTLKLSSNLTLGATRTTFFSSGTLDLNGFDHSTGLMGNSGVNDAKTLAHGSNSILLTGVGSVWNFSTTAALSVTGTGTIKCTNTSNSAITFTGGSFTYANVWFSRGASTGNITIQNSNTFSDFKDDGTAAHSILFTAGTTQTVTTFTVSGTAGQLITLNSTTTAVYNITKTTGVVSRDYLNIQHCRAGGGATFYAGVNSTNNQGVASAGYGWHFSVPDVSSEFTKML